MLAPYSVHVAQLLLQGVFIILGALAGLGVTLAGLAHLSHRLESGAGLAGYINSGFCKTTKP